MSPTADMNYLESTTTCLPHKGYQEACGHYLVAALRSRTHLLDA